MTKTENKVMRAGLLRDRSLDPNLIDFCPADLDNNDTGATQDLLILFGSFKDVCQ